MRQFLVNTAVMLFTLLLIAVAGEITVRGLQKNGYLADYRKPQKKQKSQHVYAPKLISSSNPRLYVEVDPADPQVNRFGMRGKEPLFIKRSDVLRIAVIGDSVAFGYGLKDEDSFPRMLEASLQQKGLKVEVINFAVCGYGLEAYPEVYRTKIRSFKPDLVLLAYVLNDPGKVSDFVQSVGSGMKLKAKIRRIAKTSQFAAWILTSYFKALENFRNTYMFKLMYFHEPTRAFIDEKMKELHQQTANDKVKLVTFIFPYFHNMQHYPLTAAHEVVSQVLAREKIPYHDLLEDYRPHDGIALRLEEGDFTHPNANGQRIAAEAIERYLEKEKLL